VVRPTLEPALRAQEKRGDLRGGSLTDEALASSRGVLRNARGNPNAFNGLQQWFAPRQAAALIAGVFGEARAVLDPTAGAGALLAPYPEEGRFGIEIDRDHVDGSYEAIGGDAQRVVPMMRAAGLTWPAVALNPPFGLSWRDLAHGKREMNSTVLAYLWALDLLDLCGQGALVCGRDRLSTGILSREEGRGVYAVVEVTGPLFEGVDLPTAITFFVRPDNREEGEIVRLRAGREEISGVAPEIVEARGRLAKYVSAWCDLGSLRRKFAAVKKEHADRREDARRERFDLSLKGRRISARPSAYAKLALAKKGRLRDVELLHGQGARYFGQNKRDWNKLRSLEAEGAITLSPALVEAAGRAVEEAEKISTPLFPLKPQMRLGWLTDLDRILCKKGDPGRGFEVGKDYDLSTGSKVASETESRVVENRDGDPELRRFTTERKLLEVRIGHHSFDESAENIAYIIEHFELPDPGCVATRFPDKVRENRNLLKHIARKNGFELRHFQLDHLSRLLVKGRGMLAHEPGLGKSLQQMCLAEAHARLGAKPQALFVSPQDLVLQWNRECKKFFGRRMEHVRTPAHARDVARRVRAGEAGWWITHFEALSVVGRKKEILPERPLDHRVALRQRLAERKRAKAVARGEDPARIRMPGGPTSRVACPECRADTSDGWDGEVCRRCGYVHRALYSKPAYAQLTTAFKRGVVCVDEVSEIRGDSLRSRAVRALGRGPHRYGATGTPLSNFIHDSFFGMGFCLGHGSAAFPYDHGLSGKAKYENDFAVIEYLHGRREDGEEHLKKRRKVLPQITNVSMFWRLAQPGVSRCRKEQTGEPIAERTFYPVRVPMGVTQQKMSAFWLKHFPDYFAWQYPDHPLVDAGLHEKFAAGLGQRWRLEFAATLPAADAPTREWDRAREQIGEPSNFTPANLKVLELAMEHAARGEKVLIGSDLIETGRWISARLAEKGLRAVHITEEKSGRVGTKNPRKRAADVAAFVEGDAQVLCAGTSALKLGHNLDVASTVILNGLPDSWMMFSQFLDRVHRITSTKPVSVYVLIPRNSLAERKWDLLRDKGGTSDLAFDGELSVQPEKPIDWRKEIEQMKQRGIRAAGDEVLEADVEAAWRDLEPLVPPTLITPARLAPRSEAELAALCEAEYVQAALF
jgi:hypothetical protein